MNNIHFLIQFYWFQLDA